MNPSSLKEAIVIAEKLVEILSANRDPEEKVMTADEKEEFRIAMKKLGNLGDNPDLNEAAELLAVVARLSDSKELKSICARLDDPKAEKKTGYIWDSNHLVIAYVNELCKFDNKIFKEVLKKHIGIDNVFHYSLDKIPSFNNKIELINKIEELN